MSPWGFKTESRRQQSPAGALGYGKSDTYLIHEDVSAMTSLACCGLSIIVQVIIEADLLKGNAAEELQVLLDYPFPRTCLHLGTETSRGPGAICQPGS